LGADVYTGIIVDGVHVNFGNVRVDKKIKGDKLCIVTDSLAAAGAGPELESFTFVGTTIYVKDGRCYDGNGTIAGASITMMESIKNAVEYVEIPLAEAVRMSNLYPARAIGVDDRLGSVEAGKIANLTVFTNDYKVIGTVVNGEWKVNEKSKYFNSPMLYKDNGFREKIYAEELISHIEKIADENNREAVVLSNEKKKETKNPPLLFNLAEIQNECSKRFKISPDETLKIIQELYEKKLVTYPRTDARVLSGAVAKEIDKNIKGLCKFSTLADFANNILEKGTYKNISKTKYVNDSQITDHYAIIPTGFGNMNSLSKLSLSVYELICRRFLSIFYPPAIYQKFAIRFGIGDEIFVANTKVCVERGFLNILSPVKTEGEDDETCDDQNPEYIKMISSLRKGSKLTLNSLSIKEGETVPPKRYSSGSIILAMENAGQLIEDEELRSQIKGSGIGTSATRADILKKLFSIKYLALNKKTQIITPTLFGEIVYEVVNCSISQLLNPELTASWEKGLTMVSNGDISSEEYITKLERFVGIRCLNVKQLNNQYSLNAIFEKISKEYKA